MTDEEKRLYAEIYGTPGQQISKWRENAGLSRRRFASMIGTSTRKLRAMEHDSQPEPKNEKRTYLMRYIPFLGYAVRACVLWPVEDKNFNLPREQTRLLNRVDEGYFNG